MRQDDGDAILGGPVNMYEPHFDDAATQASGRLMEALGTGRDHLVTIFANSTHSVESYMARPRERISETRQAEGLEFAAEVGWCAHALPFRDEPERLAEPGLERALIDKIAGRMVKLARRTDAAILLVPRPCGPRVHPHHRVAFRAACLAAESMADVVLCLVPDQPYSQIPLNEAVTCCGESYVPILLPLTPGDLLEKIARMSIFRSQLRPAFVKAVQQPVPGGSSEQVVETLWAPRHLAESLACRLGVRPPRQVRRPRTAVGPAQSP